MYRLHWAPRTGGFAPHAVLEECDAAYESIELDRDGDEHRRAKFMAINPLGQIPALELPDGSVLTETAAMVLHIAEAHPEAGLLPPAATPARARVYRWLMFAVCNLYENDLRFSYAPRYTTDPEGADGVREAARRRWDDAFAILDDALADGPYLLSGQYSIADSYLFMMAVWHYDPEALLNRHANLKRHCEAVAVRPKIAPLWRSYGFRYPG